jgi:FkbM family methyltransferase
MKILFVMRHSGYVRNFESTLRALADRGHTVHLAFQIADTHWLLDGSDVSRELAEMYPAFTRGVIPVRDDSWSYVARRLRFELDYLRYLTPTYRDAPKLVARAEREVSREFAARVTRGAWSSVRGRALLASWLRAQHDAIPSAPTIEAYLQTHRPDVLAVTPLIEPGAPQAEYVRSARAVGIRTALCVASWDNLTNKGLIHGDVDLVTVWNDMMKREATELHGVAAERVVVTGAQPFDHWFGSQPRTTRDEFCQRIGLPADRPYILYLCSSKFIAPDEVPFVRAWLRALRAGPAGVRDAGVLVRPHPQNAMGWATADLSDCGPVVVWPPQGQAPSDAASRADYFESMVHSAAVVGINTTAEIESAIVGRGVYTILAPEFRDTQDGTLHFQYLRQVNGGLVHAATDFTSHLDQLAAGLAGAADDRERARRFVEAFVRPYGLDVPATPKLVEALEALAQAPPQRPMRPPLWATLLRPSLRSAGERLQRDAAAVAETKAMRQASKKRPARKRDDGSDRGATPPTRTAGPPRSWKQVTHDYRALDARDRLRVGRATADLIAADVRLEGAAPERLDYPNADIYLRVTTKAERNRLRACSKEPFTIEWIHRCIGAGDVMYDIGANVGAYALVAAKRPGGGARVFAFEPSYANVAALCANVVINQVQELVTPMPFALSNREALTVFALRALEPGSARHTLGDAPSAEGPAQYRQPVFTYRLDDLIERYQLPWPQHIKLDVDGGELEVLEGASRALAAPSLRSMLVEVSTSLSEEITRLMAQFGLTLQSKVNVRNKQGEYRVWYGLFTRTGRETADDAIRVQYVSR